MTMQDVPRTEPVAANRYLAGNFAPVRDEHTLTDLPVTGQLPDWLDGRYLRIGPNPIGDPGAGYHWFMGDGMAHGIRLDGGAARWYRNRWVRSSSVTRALGEPSRGRSAGIDFADNTNVLQHAGRTLAISEAGPTPYELTDELDTVGHCTFGGTLRDGYTAHPHEDPATGELHAIGYDWRRGNRVEYTVLGTDGRIRERRAIRVGGSPMIHDCALTENYIVVLDLPVVFDIPAAARTVPRLVRPMARLSLNRVVGRSPLPDAVVAALARGPRTQGSSSVLPYAWDPSYRARIGLLPRAAGRTDVQWFDIDPCYVFHTVNAYETDAADGPATVVLDVVRHDRMFATDHAGPNEGATTLARFTLDIATGRASETRLDDHSQEFPRIDERRTGSRHRYAYTVGLRGPGFADSVVKHDLQSGRTETRSLGAAAEAGEFCFVPAPGSDTEDHGVLMGYTFDGDAGRSRLTVLDAGTLDTVATVPLPVRVPAGFHGNWAPSIGHA